MAALAFFKSECGTLGRNVLQKPSLSLHARRAETAVPVHVSELSALAAPHVRYAAEG
jgi:hypothetical protein